MPALFPESIGDPDLLYDGSVDFRGGMVSDQEAYLIDNTQCSELQNQDIDKRGKLVTRRGFGLLGTKQTSSRVQGMGYFDTASTERLVQCANTGLYTYDNSSWSSLSGYTAASSTLQLEFAQMADKIYWVDGSGSAYRWDGSTVQASSAWSVATQPPSACTVVGNHQNRLFWFIANDQTMEFSDILDPNTPNGNRVEVSGGDGDPLVGAKSWYDAVLVAFKQRSIWAVDIAAGVGSSAVLKRITDQVGCLSHRSIAKVGLDLFFLANDGVRTVSQVFEKDQNTIGDPLSFPINNWITRINRAYAHLSAGIFWNNRYLLSVPIDDSTYPNYTLVYHTVNKSWSGYWTGVSPMCWQVSAFSGILRLNIGNSDGKVMQWRDYVPEETENTTTDYQDDGTDIPSTIITKAYNFQEFKNMKLGYYLEGEFSNSHATVTISAQVDGNGYSTIASNVATQLQGGWTFPITFPLTMPAQGTKRSQQDLVQLGQFREIQPKITSSSGKLALRGVHLGAFIEPIGTN